MQSHAITCANTGGKAGRLADDASCVVVRWKPPQRPRPHSLRLNNPLCVLSLHYYHVMACVSDVSHQVAITKAGATEVLSCSVTGQCKETTTAKMDDAIAAGAPGIVDVTTFEF